MDDADAERESDVTPQRIYALWQRLTVEQREYLKSIEKFTYIHSPEHADQLAKLGLVTALGRLIVLTNAGRAVTKLG